MHKAHRFHLVLPERQWTALSSVSEKTQITISEIVRAMVERALAADQLNNLYPSVSGCWAEK